MPFLAFSQTKITGKVYDEQSKEVLIGASVFNKNGSQHSHTNTFGTFVLEGAKLGDTLLVSYLGYKPFEFEVGDDREDLRIAMTPTALQLDQITIRSEQNIISTIASVDI